MFVHPLPTLHLAVCVAALIAAPIVRAAAPEKTAERLAVADDCALAMLGRTLDDPLVQKLTRALGERQERKEAWGATHVFAERGVELTTNRKQRLVSVMFHAPHALRSVSASLPLGLTFADATDAALSKRFERSCATCPLYYVYRGVRITPKTSEGKVESLAFALEDVATPYMALSCE